MHMNPMIEIYVWVCNTQLNELILQNYIVVTLKKLAIENDLEFPSIVWREQQQL